MKHDKFKSLTVGKLALILILSLFCSGLLSSVYVLLKPIQYETTTSIYVFNRASSGTPEISYTDMMASTSLVNNYAEIVKSGLFAENIIEKLKLHDIAPKSVVEGINSKQVKNSNVLRITVRQENRILAERIAQVIPALLQEMPPVIPGAGLITVLDKPSEAEPAIGAILIAAGVSFIGTLLLAFAALLLLRPDNNIIRTPADVERTLGIKVAGTIPDFTF